MTRALRLHNTLTRAEIAEAICALREKIHWLGTDPDISREIDMLEGDYRRQAEEITK